MKKTQKNIVKPCYAAVVIGFLMLISLNSCKKLIEINPSGAQLLGSDVYKDSATVQFSLAGMYTKMTSISTANPYRFGLSTWCGFSADELQYVGSTYDAFINNGLLSNDTYAADIWNTSYAIIYVTNSIIEGVTNGSELSDKFKTQALAEAKFIRAFCYFHLMNLYGDVPLILTTDVAKNSVAGRTASSDIYTQIIADLNFAQSNLPSDYSISSNTRTRANKWAATALLARVDLYTGKWAEAETQATAVIGNTALFSLPADLTQVFTPTSKEAIWQFYNDVNGYTAIANAVLPNPVSKIPTYILTPQLIAAFEAGDARKTSWISTIVYSGSTYNYPSKYKSLTSGANVEYYTILRLAEQYLIRAEARAQQNNITGAQTDISAIRNRAGLANTTAGTQAALLLAIEQERRVELNCEWGHRWLDLKRTGRATTVLGAVKPLWKSTAALYPVPSAEIGKNANLLQNPGYQ